MRKWLKFMTEPIQHQSWESDMWYRTCGFMWQGYNEKCYLSANCENMLNINFHEWKLRIFIKCGVYYQQAVILGNIHYSFHALVGLTGGGALGYVRKSILVLLWNIWHWSHEKHMAICNIIHRGGITDWDITLSTIDWII